MNTASTVPTISQQAAQGDVLFRRVPVSDLPAKLRDATPEEGAIVVAHSETGHHHTASGSLARLLEGENPMVCYLRAESDIYIEHLRPFDTHAPFFLACGPGDAWEVRRQREWTPEGWRRVED